MGIEERQIKFEFARKVLVQHWLGHPGAFGDVVHGRGVVPLGDENFLGGREQLLTAGRAGQPHWSAGSLRAARRRHEHPPN